MVALIHKFLVCNIAYRIVYHFSKLYFVILKFLEICWYALFLNNMLHTELSLQLFYSPQIS